MKYRFLSPEPMNLGFLVLVRPIAGLLIAYAGSSLLNAEALSNDIEYFDNELGFPLPSLMVYMARSTEFFGGIFLSIGLFTRPVSFLLAFTMFIATVFANNANIFSNDGYQSTPLLIIFIIFMVIGGGKFSVDNLIFKRLSE